MGQQGLDFQTASSVRLNTAVYPLFSKHSVSNAMNSCYQPPFAARSATLLVMLLMMTCVCDTALAERPAGKPNVIVFLSDDLGYGELGAQGNKEIPTPNIDSIAENGIRFTQGYVSAPLCSPSRAGLLTGRYQTRFGHEWNEPAERGKFGLPLTETTFAERMKSLGYATSAIGKWHLGFNPKFRPMQRGFDEFYGTLANMTYFEPMLLDSRISPDPSKVEDTNFYTTDAYAERAVDWIDKHKDEPFFVYIPFNAVHTPLQATQKYLDRFTDIEDEKRKVFAAQVSSMDDATGRVLQKVREIGQEENTLIFWLSDNGGSTEHTTSQNVPLRGTKDTTLEGGVRVPFMVQWKGKIPNGKTYDNPVIQLDILPTAIAAAGGTVDPSWKLDGVNLIPYLTGENPSKPHESLFWRIGKQWAVRHGDYKLVASSTDNYQPMLFNLAEDIGEAKDLAQKNPDIVKELWAIYDKWNAEQMEPLWVMAKSPASGAAD